GGAGRGAKDEQIMTIMPYSLLAHKPGFPAKGRLRGADVFIYQALRNSIGTDDALRNFVKRVFGRGVNIGVLPNLGGSYDGTTQLDTLTRLSIAFLDGFKDTNPGIDREKNVVSPCPMLTQELATDIYRYLFQYYDAMPIQAFTNYLLILINLELFNYTLKLVNAINALVHSPDTLPLAMLEQKHASPPQLYVDFTDSGIGYSQEMAKACVRRDIETYQRFLTSTLLLRQLDSYVDKLKRNPRYKVDVEKFLRQGELSGNHYLQSLLLLQNDSIIGLGIDALASLDEDRIRTENTHDGDEDDPDALRFLDAITGEAEGSVERVIALLVEGQKENAIKNLMQWHMGVGGLKKQDGLLRGSSTNRKSWRYAPTNNLLAVLVQLAAARQKTTTSQDGEHRDVQPIRLQDFLHFLEERFGILVDRPPDQFEGAEYAAAARENLSAMLGKLRQMGIFRDLSDDFTVQRLHPPYASKDLTRAEV
ncbi:MAG TPA: hypothetical protein DHW02_10055, partial [Ktedonobacter sp.]|nr:hypothetical protein [Ktedonobacter sp.]